MLVWLYEPKMNPQINLESCLSSKGIHSEALTSTALGGARGEADGLKFKIIE